MPNSYIIFLIIFIILLTVFAYFCTKNGFIRSLYLFLRFAVPMFLSGVIVFISRFISKVELIKYIIGIIGTVIFFLVLFNVFVLPEKNKKMGIINYFLGFVIGIAIGWLIAGFVVIYLDFFNIIIIHNIISSSFYTAIITPVKWILFLDFIKF